MKLVFVRATYCTLCSYEEAWCECERRESGVSRFCSILLYSTYWISLCTAGPSCLFSKGTLLSDKRQGKVVDEMFATARNSLDISTEDFEFHASEARSP